MNIEDMEKEIAKSHKGFTKDQVHTFVTRIVDTGRYITRERAFAFYIKCDDAELKNILNNPTYLLDTKNASKLLDSNGENIHFFGLWSTDKSSIKSIIEEIHKSIKQYKTVSWYTKNMNRFILKRR
jgi:hypothetical protein